MFPPDSHAKFWTGANISIEGKPPGPLVPALRITEAAKKKRIRRLLRLKGSWVRNTRTEMTCFGSRRLAVYILAIRMVSRPGLFNGFIQSRGAANARMRTAVG